MQKKSRIIKCVITCYAIILLQGCSFHLRETTPLPDSLKQLQIVGVTDGSGLFNTLKLAVGEAGGEVRKAAKATLQLSNIREGRRVVAYNSERKARIYLISLKFNYTIRVKSNSNDKGGSLFNSRQRINLDKTFLYDANFALGKVKEEEQIRDSLYAEAARLILLRLKYAQ